MTAFKNLVGKKFNKLKVTARSANDMRGGARWKCKCSCGNTVIAKAGNLCSGATESCGCSRLKNGMSRTKIYKIWDGMIQRCTNIKNPRWEDYGGRGIKVCKRWHKVENFLEDMGERPKNKELDRENNNKGYNKKNCRWVSKPTNMNNRRNTIHITWKEKSRTLAQWARHLDIKYIVLWKRLYMYKWSIKKAFTIV